MNKDKSHSLEAQFNKQRIKEAFVNFIVPLIALVLSILIGVFVLYPGYKEVPELVTELETKQELEDVLSQKLDNLNRLIDFKSAVDEHSELVNTVLVSEELVPALLTQIDRIVRESGMNISRLSYSLGAVAGESASTDYDSIVVNLGAISNPSQLMTFLTSIENAARMVNVVSFRYGQSLDEEGEFLVNSTFVLESPYLFVESNAVTDEPLDLNISSPEFITLINKIKKLKYYDPYEVNEDVPVILEEVTEEGEEGSEEDTEATIEEDNFFVGSTEEEPVEETETTETEEDSIFP